jgi:hypothetical protein
MKVPRITVNEIIEATVSRMHTMPWSSYSKYPMQHSWNLSIINGQTQVLPKFLCA